MEEAIGKPLAQIVRDDKDDPSLFLELLNERCNAYAPWASQREALAGDARYLALSSDAARAAAFDTWLETAKPRGGAEPEEEDDAARKFVEFVHAQFRPRMLYAEFKRRFRNTLEFSCALTAKEKEKLFQQYKFAAQIENEQERRAYMQSASRTGRSELLKDLLEAGRGGSQSAGLNTKMRGMVTEVTQVSPLRLANLLSSIAQKAATNITSRSADYVDSRIDKQGLAGEELRIAKRETQDLFAEFLSALKLALMEQFVEVENYIFNNTYLVDAELFAGGFVRFAHQEGIDYTHADNAQALAASVDAAEAALEAKLKDVQRLRGEVEDIEEALPKLDALLQWLDTALASGIDAHAPEIRAMAEEVARGVETLQKRLP